MSNASQRKLSQSILDRARGKVRRFPSPQGGDRVNVWAIVLKYKVWPLTVYNKLDGLKTEDKEYTVGAAWNGGGTRTTRTWLESEVNERFADPMPSGYGSAAEAIRKTGIAYQTLK